MSSLHLRFLEGSGMEGVDYMIFFSKTVQYKKNNKCINYLFMNCQLLNEQRTK
jgi:hypothetical protein